MSTEAYQSLFNESVFNLYSSSVYLQGLTANKLLYCNSSSQLGSANVGADLVFSGGTLGTIQPIQTTSTPTYAGLNLTGFSGVLKATAGSISATTLTSDDISEGKTNLYYTNARARAALSSTNPISYNSSTGAIGLNYDGNFTLSGSNLSTIQPITTTSNVVFRSVSAGAGGFTGALSGNASTASALNSTGAAGTFWANNNTWATPTFSGSLTSLSVSNPYVNVGTGGGANTSLIVSSNLTSIAANLRDVGVGSVYNNAITGLRNSAFGIGSGIALTSGSDNVLYGDLTGTLLNSGGTNTLIGSQAGKALTTTSGNVFLGYSAGSAETGSNKLYISNSSTTNPLIGGDFTSQYVNIYNKLNVNSTQTTQSLYVNGNSQIMGRFGVNAIGPGACANITGESTNGIEAQTLYVAGAPLRNATYSANYSNITTYFQDVSTAGAFYNYYGLNIGQNAGASARIANSFGGYFSNPNMSTTGYNLALYADDVTIGSVSGKIAGGFYCHGSTQIRTQQSLGTTAPQTNTRLYISAGGIATENFTIQSNAYPVRTAGASSYANITAYANWVSLSGGTMNYYAIDTGSTSGSSPYIGSSYGIYCRNPGASTTPANNIACYADDISVGNVNNKIANGIYCSSDLKCGGALYNGTYSTSSPFYAVSTASATVQMGTNSTTVTVSYRRVGSVVTCRIPPWTNNYSSAGNATIAIPSGFIPTSTAQNVTYWPYTSTALISAVSMILVNSSGTLTFYNGSVGTFPTGSYSSFANQIVFTYIID